MTAVTLGSDGSTEAERVLAEGQHNYNVWHQLAEILPF